MHFIKFTEHRDLYLKFSEYRNKTVCLEIFSEEHGFIGVLDDNFECDELCGKNRIAILESNDHVSDFLIENDIATFKGWYTREVINADTKEPEVWYYSIHDVIEGNKWKFEAERLKRNHCYVCQKFVLRDTMQMVEDRYGIARGLACEDCFEKADAELKRWVFDPADAGESLEGEM